MQPLTPRNQQLAVRGTATEGGSRSVALTKGPTGGGRLIPTAEVEQGKPVSQDWSRVTWRGELLQQGRRAAAEALRCLDQEHPV